MSLDLGRIERASKALAAAMEAGSTLPYSLAMALELAGLLAPTDLATAVAEHGPFPMPTGDPSPWERAVTGLNTLADAGIPFSIEPDGHIANPFGDEHIEWDQDASRWRLVHDDEDADDVHPQHPAPCRIPSSPDCTCPPAELAEAEALAAVDRSIAAQFPAVAAFLAEDPHDSPLHTDYATPHDLPEVDLTGEGPRG